MPGIGLKGKITLAVSTLVLSIISFTAFFSVSYFEKHFRETISNQQFALVSVIADDLDSKIINARDLLINISRKIGPALASDEGKARAFLEQQTEAITLFDNGIFLFNHSGAMIAEAPISTGRTGKDFSFREYFKRTITSGKPYISKPYLSSQQHRHPAVMFTVPLFDQNHRITGVLAGSLDLTKSGLLSRISDTRIGNSGYLFLYDTDRTIIMHPDRSRILQQDVPYGVNRLFDRAIEGFDGTGENVNSRGLRALSSFKRLRAAEWIVGANFPVAEAYAPFDQAKKYFLLSLVPILLITVLILAFLLKYLTTPLRVFARHVEELPHKEGSEKLLRIRTSGEIGALVTSFNRMVQELDSQKEAIQKSEELYRTIAEFTSDFVFWMSVDRQTMHYASPCCEPLTGYSDAEFQQSPRLLDEMIHPDDQATWQAHVAVSCGSDCSEPLELRIITKSCSVRWVYHQCCPVYGETGELLGVRGSFSDISDRKRVEEDQRQQLHFLQTMIDAIPGPVFYKDVKGAYLGCNTAFERYIGVAREQLVGKTVFELYPEELARVYFDADIALFQHPGVQCYEAQVLFNEGTLRDVMFYKSTFSNIDGTIGGMVGTLLDITERNTTERALRQSEEKFRLFFEESRDAIFVTDRECCLINVNQSAQDMFGYSREEILGLNICETFCDAICKNTLMEEITSKGYVREEEVRLRRKDGTALVSLLSASLRKSESGELLGFQGIFHDITERKRAEETLVRQNEYLAALHETTMGLIGRLEPKNLLRAVIKRAGTLMKTGHSYIYLLDTTCDEMVRQTSTGVFSGFLDVRVRKGEGLVGQVWETGMPLAVDDYHFWSRRLRDPARDVLHAMVGVPLKSRELVVGVIGLAHVEEGKLFEEEEIAILSRFAELASIALDNARLYAEAQEELQERKRAEEELRKLSHAVEQSPVSVVITDTVGNIEYVNPKFTEITGYSPEEVIGHNPNILKSGEIPKEVYENLWKTITAGHEWRGEFLNKKKSGEPYWEMASISPIRNGENVITHFIAVKEDITERRKLESQLRHSQKMDAVGQLAGGIAHDFNNILTAIIGYASILEKRLDEQSPLRNSATQILHSAKRAANLTQGLLAFSRKQITNPRPVKINDIVRRVEKLLERIIGEDIAIMTQLSDAEPVVMADSLQMEQVLMNLANNARDAMPGGGTMTISTELMVLDHHFAKVHGFGKPGTYARLSVADTGTGMDGDMLKKIFEPFFTTKEVGKGTGLGLSIVYGIIKKHNGYVVCYSEPRMGTVFNLFLPVVQSRVEEPAAEIVQQLAGGTETILIAEDDGVVRAFVRELLEEYGYTLIEACDGEEAVAKFRQYRDTVQLLILDLIMPKKNGQEAYAEIRKMKADVKAIFSSGYTADVIQKKGKLATEINYLPKPVAPEQLLLKIREVLDT